MKENGKAYKSSQLPQVESRESSLGRHTVPVPDRSAGFGFVESLIAIVAGGITCIALVNVAVMVIREAKNNEIRDALTYYTAEGMQRVRVVASNDYSEIEKMCDLPSGTKNGYLSNIEGDPSDPYINELSPDGSGFCSGNNWDEGECEKLALPSGGGAILYRELMFTPTTQGCDLMKVTVRVGMKGTDSASGEYVRNFDTEITLDGYVTR